MSKRASKCTNWIALAVTSLSLSVAGGCAAQGGAGAGSSTAAGKSEDSSGDELAEAKRNLANAKKKLEAAKLRSKQAEADDRAALVHLATEQALAAAELKQFDEQDAPNRLAQKRIETQAVRDQLADDTEELQQLEMMYAAEDLADQTKQIVLQRGKRKLVRSQDRLAIAERELAMFEQFTLPRERSHLELEVAAKARALESEKSGYAITKLEKQVEVSDAEHAMKDCERSLARLEKTQPEPPPQPAAPEKEPAKEPVK